MIQYLLDEYNRTFKESHGLLVIMSGQIVCCLIIFLIKPMHIQQNAYFVNSQTNIPFQQVLLVTKYSSS